MVYKNYKYLGNIQTAKKLLRSRILLKEKIATATRKRDLWAERTKVLTEVTLKDLETELNKYIEVKN